jgi:hypothetical protein
MSNDFLSKILQGNYSYWVVLKRVPHYLDHNNNESIWFFGLGSDISISIPYDEIKLKDIERLGRAKLTNIPLFPYYPPFQEGITLSDAIDGFPVHEGNICDFLARAIQLKSKELHHYHALLVDPSTKLK